MPRQGDSNSSNGASFLPAGTPLRVAIDLTNSPHVPFFAPLVRLLESSGCEVFITARRFAQTVELSSMHGLDVTVTGEHGGASRLGKARAAASRTFALRRLLRREHRAEPIDVAMSHGSTDLPVVARWLGVPHVTIFDYEWARTMHRLNCRLSWRVLTPDAIPPDRLDRYGAAGKLLQYPGLKEEYYLAGAQLDDGIRADMEIPHDDVLVLLRPPPSLALYHRGHGNDLFEKVLDRVSSQDGCTAVVLARTPEQREAISGRHANNPKVIVPDRAIDGASLLAASDLMVSAGGTMNREAVALGVPVHTVFAGRLGGVDEQLLASGRMHQLTSAESIPLVRRALDAGSSNRSFRDPGLLLELALRGLPAL